jgi:excisionase family DNA binding protein
MKGIVNATDRLAYSVDETAVMLGLSSKSVRRLLGRGLLKGSRALRVIRISRSEIERFLKDTTWTPSL